MGIPMKRQAVTALSALALSGCSVYREATQPLPNTAASWRSIVTEGDRLRLRDWHKAWDEALPAARAANPQAIAGEPELFDPDRALGAALPPPGPYRCRTFKLGSQSKLTPDFAVSEWFECRLSAQGEVLTFTQTAGQQRPTGILFPDTDARRVFVGALVLGDETAPLRYGLDSARDMIGYVERIGDKRWRLVLPHPHFESKLDVVELIPR